MKKDVLLLGLSIIAAFSGSSASAQSDLFFTTEATFLKYHRSAGSQVGDGPGDVVNFDLDFSPRFTLGASNANGTGARVRFWDFDHNAGSTDSLGSIDVQAQTIDFEVFNRIKLSDYSRAELSVGLRRAEFSEVLRDGGDIAANRFTGVGAIFGASIRRDFGPGAIRATGRFSIMMDDKSILDDSDGPTTHNDSIVSVAEMGIHYEVSREIGRTLWTGSLGTEWQKWTNFTEGHDIADDDSLDFRGGGGDVGFVGAVAGLTIAY